MFTTVHTSNWVLFGISEPLKPYPSRKKRQGYVRCKHFRSLRQMSHRFASKLSRGCLKGWISPYCCYASLVHGSKGWGFPVAIFAFLLCKKLTQKTWKNSRGNRGKLSRYRVGPQAKTPFTSGGNCLDVKGDDFLPFFLGGGKVKYFIARRILYQIVTFDRDPEHVALKFRLWIVAVSTLSPGKFHLKRENVQCLNWIIYWRSFEFNFIQGKLAN